MQILPFHFVSDRSSILLIEFFDTLSFEIALLEFLTQPKAQVLYSSINYEYPVNPDMQLTDELKSWGEFKEDKLPVEKLAELAPIAQKIIDRVGW